MLSREAIAENWKKVVCIYESTISQNNPSVTALAVVEELGYENTVETFAGISKLKKNDGRIYGENRRWMDSVPLVTGVEEWNHGNPVVNKELDAIHTTHINNIITELRKMKV